MPWQRPFPLETGQPGQGTVQALNQDLPTPLCWKEGVRGVGICKSGELGDSVVDWLEQDWVLSS